MEQKQAWDWVYKNSRVCQALWSAGFSGPQSAERGPIMEAAQKICVEAYLAGMAAARGNKISQELPMTADERKRLRELAYAAALANVGRYQFLGTPKAHREFIAAFDPATALRLLDELDRMDVIYAELEEDKKYWKALFELRGIE